MANWIKREQLSGNIAYLQIIEIFEAAVHDGTLSPGKRLPTHRELAADLKINVGTVSRAYRGLQERDLIESRPRLGTFVKRRVEPATRTYDNENDAPAFVDLGTNTRITPAFAAAFGPTLVEIGQSSEAVHRIEGYKPIAGLAEHRGAIADWLSDSPGAFSADQILITDSTSTSILATLMTLCTPGDVVLSESMTFPMLKPIAAGISVSLHGVTCDGEGMVPEALEAACERYTPRAIVITPTLHNPTCAIMGLERRKAVVGIAERYGVTLVEDDIYHFMVPPDQRLPRLASLLPDRTILVSSLSKTIAQGLRIGHIAAPPEWAGPIARSLQGIAFNGPTLMAEIFTRWIEDGTATRVVDAHRAEVSERHAHAAPLLAELGCVSHAFSAHSWLALPPTISASEIFAYAMRAGVGTRLGEEFAVEPTPSSNGLRITIGAAETGEALVHALSTLRDIVLSGTSHGRLMA